MVCQSSETPRYSEGSLAFVCEDEQELNTGPHDYYWACSTKVMHSQACLGK